MMDEFYNCVDVDLKKFCSKVDRENSRRSMLVINTDTYVARLVLNTMCNKHGWTFVDARRSFGYFIKLFLTYKN